VSGTATRLAFLGVSRAFAIGANWQRFGLCDRQRPPEMAQERAIMTYAA